LEGKFGLCLYITVIYGLVSRFRLMQVLLFSGNGMLHCSRLEAEEERHLNWALSTM